MNKKEALGVFYFATNLPGMKPCDTPASMREFGEAVFELMGPVGFFEKFDISLGNLMDPKNKKLQIEFFDNPDVIQKLDSIRQGILQSELAAAKTAKVITPRP